LLLPGGERVVLADTVTRVGRLPDCGVQLGDASVSRHHAEVRSRGDGFVVVDLGSTNGTRVNGVRVDERELRDGDEVRFGTVRVQFSAS
jgi:pSer/pThr/pTyr-binding forkhead associated (FHA) protein